MSMLLSKIYKYINLPDKTYLGTRIAKKQLIENSQLTSSDKKAVQEDIEAIIWRNTLKNTTINISPYQAQIEEIEPEAEFKSYLLEYNEIAIIEVSIRATARAKKIAELIQRAIPYPLLVVLSYQGENKAESQNDHSVLLSLATKRVSKADHNKLTIERFYQSSRLNESHLNIQNNNDPIEIKFLKALAVEKQSFVNFYEFYMGWVKQFLELEKSKYTNEFQENAKQSVNIAQAKSQAKLLDTISSLESKLTGLRQKIKQENQINRKVELNIQAQKIKQELTLLTAELS